LVIAALVVLILSPGFLGGKEGATT